MNDTKKRVCTDTLSVTESSLALLEAPHGSDIGVDVEAEIRKDFNAGLYPQVEIKGKIPVLEAVDQSDRYNRRQAERLVHHCEVRSGTHGSPRSGPC